MFRKLCMFNGVCHYFDILQNVQGGARTTGAQRGYTIQNNLYLQKSNKSRQFGFHIGI